jgi:hypothetical protein
MKKAVLLFFVLLPCSVFSQSKPLDWGNASFLLDTKIMEDGSIINVGFGLNYNNVWGGEIRGQAVKTSTNEKEDDPAVADSLIAVKETVYEIFLLPIQYRPTVNQNLKWRLGIGLHYEYQKSNQKGYIDMPELEILGFAQVNAYTDDFSMHLFGSLMDAAAQYDAEWFNITFSVGAVPVYFLTAAETQRMFPLFNTVNHSQETWGSPYFYLGLDSILFQYVNLTAKYNYARLKYEVIDLDFDAHTSEFFPVFPESTVVSQTLMFEISALLPLGGVGFRIGYGYMLNFYTLDSGNPVSENKHYLVLSGKK